MRSMLILGVLAVCVLGTQVATASTGKKVPGYTNPSGFKFTDTYPFLTQDQQKEQLAAARKEANRKVAEDNSGEKISESDESQQLRTFITNLTNARSASDLDKLIDQANIDADNKDAPDDLKLYATLLAPMKASRGWLYKIRPYLNGRVGRPHSFRNSLVTAGKLLASYQNVLFPNTHWDAGYEYVNTPNEDDVSVFNTPLELQNYVASAVLPRLITTAARLKQLAEKKGEIIWDGKAVFGKFRDDGVGRFRIVKAGNIHALLSAYHLAISNLQYSYCYNIDGLVEVMDDFNVKLLAGSILPDSDGVSAKERVEILRGSNPKFLTLKTDAEIQQNVGRPQKYLLDESQNHLLEAISEAQIAYESVRDSKEGGFDFIAPAAFRPYQTIINKSFDQARAMWSRVDYPVTSDVTGETLISSLPKFFTNPPASLKAFAPEPPAKTDEFGPIKVGRVPGSRLPHPYRVRNFKAGSATSWDLPKYQPYFPQISNQGIPKATQILSQTWGAANLFLFVQ